MKDPVGAAEWGLMPTVDGLEGSGVRQSAIANT